MTSISHETCLHTVEGFALAREQTLPFHGSLLFCKLSKRWKRQTESLRAVHMGCGITPTASKVLSHPPQTRNLCHRLRAKKFSLYPSSHVLVSGPTTAQQGTRKPITSPSNLGRYENHLVSKSWASKQEWAVKGGRNR